MLRSMPHYDGSQIYRIINNDSYFLLYFLEDLFTECMMPIMYKIWKYLRNPTSEERKWLTLLEGEQQANKVIIDKIEHRHEWENEIRHKSSGIETINRNKLREKRIEKIYEIVNQFKTLLEELINYLKIYGLVIKRHRSLQYIFEIMFPDFTSSLNFADQYKSKKS